ncbi:toxin-antitoxin system HicB family antitoxin [Streptomyces sp. NBC_01235]|uniref:toxin-antitoxin system HicB family antitoxin n=1 Tax=Streptomyces sp. NBC_01235 TaxID=2903788 RepID=UPI002E0FFD61|nr:toxin-antitoxin system HicB family antitoxin [Streptomyces sp. NBC_01235]
MKLTPYVDNLRREFLATAAATGEEPHALAERLLASLDASVRLMLLEVLSAAADEISREFAPGSVDIRLQGLDPSFVVTQAPSEAFHEDMTAPSVTDPQAEGTPARINFRVPGPLKARIEEAARQSGLSVNAWLVRAVNDTLHAVPSHPQRRPSSGQRHVTGWVR